MSNAQMLGQAQPMPAPGMPGLPSTTPALYQQILGQIQQAWAVEDAQIHEARKNELYQSVLAVCAPQDAGAAMAPPADPGYLLGGGAPAE